MARISCNDAAQCALDMANGIFGDQKKREGLNALPSKVFRDVNPYFRMFTLKFAGGSNSDRDGSLNCTFASL